MLPLEFVFELFAYLAVLVAVYWFSGVHEYLTKLNRSLFIFLILFFYLLVVGQINKTPSQTYPFVNWSMYSQRIPNPSYVKHIITLEDGTVKHYPYEYITFTSPRAFMRKVERLEITARDSSSVLLQETLQGLVDIYKEKNPKDEIIGFALIENVISIPKRGAGYDISVRERFLYEPK